LRGKVRKARREGANFAASGADAVAGFYSVFARNMRDLGTPVYPSRFFERIVAAFPDEAVCFLATVAGRPAAAAFGLKDAGCLRLPWICSDYELSGTYINEFLYWSVLEWAHGQGFRAVDLGRSTAGGGNHRFKMQWLPCEKPLFWYYWTSKASPPDICPENRKYAAAIRCWRHLPIPIANFVGPRIVRNLA
jgi:predicted N-acyltransferase